MSQFSTFQSTGIYCLSNKNPACSDKNRQINGLITYPRQAGSKNRQMNGLIACLYILFYNNLFKNQFSELLGTVETGLGPLNGVP